jgi:hypothetical protein
MVPYEDIPNSLGMKVLRNVPGFEGKQSKNVVIRSITEDYWNEVIKATETINKDTRVCAVGTPGIGKTTASTVLIRLLLNRMRTVVYCVKKPELDGWVYEFTPIQETIGGPLSVEVNVYMEDGFKYDDVTSLTQKDSPPNYYIVDPGATKNNCCPSEAMNGRFILVASPDEHHWEASEFKKERGGTSGTFRYFPVWSLDELLAARPYIRDDFSDDDVKQRYRQFGGVPRNVFNDESDVKEMLASQVEASNKLTPNQLTEIGKAGWNGVSTFSELHSKSAILGYGWSGSEYTDLNVVPISEKVIETIFVKHQAFLWNTFSRYTDSSVAGLFFEMVCNQTKRK